MKDLKRVFDVILSVFLIVTLSPFLIWVSFMVFFTMGKPILFKQKRPGYKGEPFVIYKFRTMSNQRDSKGNLLPDEKRITPFGAFLRKTSLDELPELFNVLKGEMSFVGPRPLRMKYLDRYNQEQFRRHEVKPGITGWAQIQGRNLVDWEERFKKDVWYVDNWNFWLDIKIILKTFFIVLKREGINSEGHPSMPEFLGKEKENEVNGK